MKTAQVEIESSHHVKRDSDGLGKPAGESYNLVCTLGGKVFRTMRFYGDAGAQELSRDKAQADIKTKVEIEK